MITLAQADAVIDATIAEAERRGLRPMAVAVVDASGVIKAFKKADGASALRFEMAMGKAYAAVALSFGRSGAIRDFLDPRPRFHDFLDQASQGRLWAEPGGVRILGPAGETLGGVGVTGDVSVLDEECAVAGIVADCAQPTSSAGSRHHDVTTMIRDAPCVADADQARRVAPDRLRHIEAGHHVGDRTVEEHQDIRGDDGVGSIDVGHQVGDDMTNGERLVPTRQRGGDLGGAGVQHPHSFPRPSRHEVGNRGVVAAVVQVTVEAQHPLAGLPLQQCDGVHCEPPASIDR
jgi:uncharacterized protein GlcG (DUF336 family)